MFARKSFDFRAIFMRAPACRFYQEVFNSDSFLSSVACAFTTGNMLNC